MSLHVHPVHGSPVPDEATSDIDRALIDLVLSNFLADKETSATNPHLPMFVGLLREFLCSGKRLRPLLCCCGWRAVTGQQTVPAMVTHIAASLELFQAFVLIQDDVMDNSDTRRGRPSLHRVIASRHPDHPRAERCGQDTAILISDLALGWSYELVHAAGMTTAQARVLWPLLDSMRTDTMTGQYLDLLATGTPGGDIQTALRICRYKTAKYTIEYPLLLGAHLADATPNQVRALSGYALPLGEAFQLRDDLLSVFGNPEITGKSVLDDLRDGKNTVLAATAFRHASPAQRRTLHQHLGNQHLDHHAAEQIRTVMADTGAVAVVEQMIADRHAQAVSALDTADLQSTAVTALRHLAAATSVRAA